MERRINIKFMENVPKDLGITIGENSIRIEYDEDERNKCVVNDNNNGSGDKNTLKSNENIIRNEMFNSGFNRVTGNHDISTVVNNPTEPEKLNVPVANTETVNNENDSENIDELLNKINICKQNTGRKMTDEKFGLLEETMRLFRKTRDGRLIDVWGYSNYNSFQNSYYVQKSKRASGANIK